MSDGLPLPPSDLLGDLFSAVQQRGLFSDSKTFADVTPRRALAAIRADWSALGDPSDEALRAFVRANFILPGAPDATASARASMVAHIHGLWDVLTRPATPDDGDLSAIGLPRRFVVPGGRFRELYYWDSYFTMLGLARSGRQDLIEDMIADFGSLLDRFGHIPNGTRSYYLSRSHPPFFYLMAELSHEPAGRAQRLAWLRIEHRFWMDGANGLAPSTQRRRVVRMADGAVLNRYWDDRADPRDESWREDMALVARSQQAPDALFRNIRAAAESGWDFSTRWLGDGDGLGTIRTTRIVPVDLNCLLFGLEETIAREAAALGDAATAAQFAAAAAARGRAIRRHLWNEAAGHFCDFDLDADQPTGHLTAAALFALFTGVADPVMATRTGRAAARLLRPGGLMTTERRSGEQWDAPNGWAPLQWIAVAGLRRFGIDDLADTIAARWLAMVEQVYEETGQLLEKYDVEDLTGGGGGEYGNEIGFGWTNGVTLALLDTRPADPVAKAMA